MDKKLFLIIGAMKSGTTSLHDNLCEHPSIGMTNYKEPNFFNKNYYKGEDWYTKKFSNIKDVEYYGDATPAYSWKHIYPNTAANIYSFNPKTKLIYIVRDPIERIISHLHHDIYRDRIKPEAINKEGFDFSNYINTSKYYWQIEAYLKFWRPEDILFLNFNDLKNNRLQCLNKIYNFLGITEDLSKEKQKVSNTTSKKFIIKYYDVAHRVLPSKLTKYYHYFWYFVSIKKEKPFLSENTLNFLKSELQGDIDNLQKISGMNVTGWSTYNGIK